MMSATPSLSSPPARPLVDGWYAVPTGVERTPHRVGDTVRTVERLPFTVRVAHSAHDLEKAAAVRYEGYARHLDAALTARLREPEPLDRAPGVAVLLAESRVDGSALGTLRIQTNAFQPLALEQSFTLPDEMANDRCAEVTRLAVTQAIHSRVVKTVLLKAAFFWALRASVHYIIVAARAPLDRQYQRIFFCDIDPVNTWVPLSYAFNILHRVMYCDIAAVHERSQAHPLYDFWFNTDHPDIDLD